MTAITICTDCGAVWQVDLIAKRPPLSQFPRQAMFTRRLIQLPPQLARRVGPPALPGWSDCVIVDQRSFDRALTADTLATGPLRRTAVQRSCL